jgi:hypothetical protein
MKVIAFVTKKKSASSSISLNSMWNGKQLLAKRYAIFPWSPIGVRRHKFQEYMNW